ncbi:hypothetical protein ACFVXW_10925 [Streptomyces sp. NPDC058251]
MATVKAKVQGAVPMAMQDLAAKYAALVEELRETKELLETERGDG